MCNGSCFWPSYVLTVAVDKEHVLVSPQRPPHCHRQNFCYFCKGRIPRQYRQPEPQSPHPCHRKENADSDNTEKEDTTDHTDQSSPCNTERDNGTDLQDMIRTSTLEIIKGPDDIERLLENGVLTMSEETKEITKRAEAVLPHRRDRRCIRRIGPGESPENFSCRKPHSVKKNPDPTIHSYVPFNQEYQPHFLETMEEIGMYQPLLEVSNATKIGDFTHSYFDPRRHMAPCNWNATCNMSPVIPDFLMTVNSMHHAHILAHIHGLAKYVTKYITKVDQGNYVVLCQDGETGQWVLTMTHLHNTKSVSSKINKDKAFDQQKFKNHPRGHDYGYFEMKKITMGDHEVLTDLNFLELSTLPFELRPTNGITLDYDSDAIEDPADSYSTGAPMQRAWPHPTLREQQRMTSSQARTYRNHRGKRTKYCMISVFSLRSPELLGVF